PCQFSPLSLHCYHAHLDLHSFPTHALPILFTLLTTGYKPTVSPLFHYSMHWAPYLFLAAPIALAAITRESTHGKLKAAAAGLNIDRKSTRLNSSHVKISYAVFCLKKKNNIK